MKTIRLFMALSLFIMLGQPLNALAMQKLALVIGNSKYPAWPLKNPDH